MNNRHNEEYDRAAGTNHAGEEDKPVLDAASPAVIAIATLVILIFMGLLGWGLMIVFGV